MPKNRFLLLTALLIPSLLSTLAAQAPPETPAERAAKQALAGMWSDAPYELGVICFNMCSQEAVDRFFALLDDPANDDIPIGELNGMARQETIGPLLDSVLTDFSREGYPLSGDTDPGFLECKPRGYGRQIFTPHQNEVTVYPDRIEMHYGEWDGRRTIWMDGRTPPAGLEHSLLGYSVGHMEGDVLVVNTSHVAADRFFRFNHSDQLTGLERYYVSEGGELLNMDVTFTDPVAMSKPITLKKIWGWAPDEEIFPYDSCEIPTDYLQNLEDAQ